MNFTEIATKRQSCRNYDSTRPVEEEKVYGRVRAGLITYGDKIDVASTVLLARRFKSFSLRSKFAELCAMLIGIVVAIVFSIVGVNGTVTLLASLWQLVWSMLLRMFSYNVFLRQHNQQED